MKIVIVGGGTAGWLSALYMSIFNKDRHNEVIVIESSKIPIIGAGEGSTGILSRTIKSNFVDMGINELEFLYNTEATQKMGLYCKDWNGIGTDFYSPLHPTDTALGSTDFDLLVSMCMGDYYDGSPTGYLQANGYSAYGTSKSDFGAGSAYHFDAHKVGEYFKSVAVKQGVKCIDTEVTSLNRNSLNGKLESVETTTGKIEADFWIDCSGFARVLIGPMGGGWKSFSEYLPVNGAIPYIHEFQKDEDVRLETLSWAMPNGWMWQIPTQKRYGCGYVYSDMFTSYDNALNELIKITGRNIEPLRNIKFDVGRVDKFWINNVVAVGLASSFLEPLQATSIHSTIVQMNLLKAQFLRTSISNTINDINRNKYNEHIGNMVDDFKDLIQMQYMTDREDTEFWKYCKYELPKTDFVKYILDASKYRTIGSLDFKEYFGGAGWAVWGWTLAGLNHLNTDTATAGLNVFDAYELSKKRYDRNLFNANIASIKYLKSKDFMKALIDKKIK